MLNKKTKGIVIIAIVLFAIFYVAKINVKMKELEKDNQALRDKQTEVEQCEDENLDTEESSTQATTEEVATQEITTEEITTEEITTEEMTTAEPTTEETTTEEVVVNNGVDLLSIHTIIGDTSDYFEESRGVMDNVGNTHEHAYYIYRFFRYDGDDVRDLVFCLNGNYNTLVLENIALPEEDKDAFASYYVSFYGDGNYLGGTSEFTAGVYPQERLEIDVTGVKELSLDFTRSVWGDESDLIVESMKLY